MKIYIQLGVVVFILISGMNAGRKDPLYESIESYLVKYRQSIKTNDLTLQNGIIHLELNGRRTNLKSQLLLGFYSIGRALQKSTTPYREVQIVIYYDLKERQEILVKAPAEVVLDLSQGRFNSEQFFAIIGY